MKERKTPDSLDFCHFMLTVYKARHVGERIFTRIHTIPPPSFTLGMQSEPTGGYYDWVEMGS